MRRTPLPYLALAGLLVACGPVDTATLERPEGQREKPMLPAYRTVTPDQALTFNQYRDLDPQTYGITSGPAAPHVVGAEFDPQDAIMLTWTGQFPDVYATIIDATRNRVPIYVFHDGWEGRDELEYYLGRFGVSTSGLRWVDAPVNSVWVRDFGPISIRDGSGRVALVDPRYYPDRVGDDALPTWFAAQKDMNVFRMPFNFEGGNFMTDGRGTCFISDAWRWQNPISESTMKKYFREYLGCWQTIVLYALEGEGTGHIDMFTKMVDPTTVLLGEYRDGDDRVNAQVLEANASILRNVRLADGGRLDIVRMPMPANWDGNFRTYINSQFVNGVNLVPIYRDDDRFEDESIAIWRQVLPSYNHVLVDATELIRWAGAVHCIIKEIEEGSWAPFQQDPYLICENVDCYPGETYGNYGCGGVSVGGQCVAGEAQWCEFGEVQATECSGSCGWSGSRGRMYCSGDTATATFTEPEAPPPPVEETPTASAQPQDPCFGITYNGCCEGSMLVYCEDNQLWGLECDTSCGWDGSNGWYDCGLSGGDPSGSLPHGCGL